MRVAVISDSRRRGGAALATARVFDSLIEKTNWEIRWFVSQDDGSQDDRTVVFTGPGIVRRSVQTLRGKQDPLKRRLLRIWACMRNRRNLWRLMRRFSPDVISLHSINEWTDAALPRSIAADLRSIAPVVWTLHDMWPLTGWSDYPAEYQDANLSDEQAYEKVFGSAQRAADELNGGIDAQPLVFAAPSRWIGDLAKRVFDGRNRVEHIPHGVDLTEFKSLPQDEARRLLDIPDKGPVIAAAATSIHSPRKGLRFLVEALAKLEKPVTLALFGHFRQIVDWPTNVRVVPLGFLGDVRLLRAAYSSADVFVAPSLAEMFGLVLIESMACGTPCVGFETGGIPEIIRPGHTGYLAPRGDASALANAIDRVLSQTADGKAAMRAACRRVVEQEFDLRMEVQRYADLFSELAARG